MGLRTALTAATIGLASSLSLSSEVPSRRDVLARAAVAAVGAPALLQFPLPAFADVRGINEDMPRDEREINRFLKSMGYSEIKVPSGASPLVEYIGAAPAANIDGIKARERAFKSALLVRFVYPSGWLVQTPTITENGEAGTIGANNYIKGDSAQFTAVPLPAGKELDELKGEFFKGFVAAQMSNDVYEDVKIKKPKVVKQADGTDLCLFDLSYTLLTRAGFTVERLGVGSAQIVDGAVVGLVTATTLQRYKDLEGLLRAACESFRAYPVKSSSSFKTMV